MRKALTVDDFTKYICDAVGNEYIICDRNQYTDVKTKIDLLHNRCGTVYNVSPAHFKAGTRCPLCKRIEMNEKITLAWQKKSEQYILSKKKDYQKEMIENHNDEYSFIDFYMKEGKNKKTEGFVKIEHKICKRVFERRAVSWATNKRCPHCSNMLKVSYLHAIIAELSNSQYPESKVEYDIGFKGISGGVSKYDLYIPKLNGVDTVIEFQSRFHDNKKEFDENKKQYAIQKGYKYFSFDHRNYTVEQVLSELDINKIESISKDIRASCYAKKDIFSCQKYVDDNVTVENISEITGISSNIINHSLATGILIPKPNRKEIVFGKKAIVQLDIDGNLIAEYNSGYDVYRDNGYKISSCLNGRCNICHGYVFITKENYLKGNYSIKQGRNFEGVVKLDSNGNVLDVYSSAKLASSRNNVDHSSIVRCANHQYKTAGGYKWLHYSDYIKQQEQTQAV